MAIGPEAPLRATHPVGLDGERTSAFRPAAAAGSRPGRECRPGLGIGRTMNACRRDDAHTTLGRRFRTPAAYTALQARGRRRLNCGVVTLDLGPSRQLTTVARPHSELAARLASTAQRLPASDRQYLYPVDDLHLTVLNLDQSAVGDRLAQDLAREVLAATAPFPVALRGLGVSSQSVYVQAYDRTGALLALRRRLSRVTGSRPPLGPAAAGVRQPPPLPDERGRADRDGRCRPPPAAARDARGADRGDRADGQGAVPGGHVAVGPGRPPRMPVDPPPAGRPYGRLSADVEHRARPHPRNQRRRPAAGISEEFPSRRLSPGCRWLRALAGGLVRP